jgi:hypothetical protein
MKRGRDRLVSQDLFLKKARLPKLSATAMELISADGTGGETGGGQNVELNRDPLIALLKKIPDAAKG